MKGLKLNKSHPEGFHGGDKYQSVGEDISVSPSEAAFLKGWDETG